MSPTMGSLHPYWKIKYFTVLTNTVLQLQQQHGNLWCKLCE